jgi:hypothetical protein
LERLVQMCELYLKNTALKQRRFEGSALCFQLSASVFMSWPRNCPVFWTRVVVFIKACHWSLYGASCIHSFYRICCNSILSYTSRPQMWTVSFP